MTKSESAPTPERLGPFEVLGELGRGGSGVVYRARWGHREVALKVIHPGGANASEHRRFLDEANRLATLGHPNVVKILGAGALDDGRPYLAMELLEGRALASRLAEGPLELERALALFGQLAGAVSAMHDAGLIHRDLKPENVFLTADEEHALVLDFGIAKELDAPASTVTQEGGIRGTPATMAPERFFGAPASIASDVYELAVVLFAMLSGQLPWRSAGDPGDRLAPRRLHELGCEAPAMIDAAIARALSTRAEMRPASAAELLRDVQAAADDTTRARHTADLRPKAEVNRALDTTDHAPTAPGALHGARSHSTIESGPTLPLPVAADGPVASRSAAHEPRARVFRARAIAIAAAGIAVLTVVLAIALWPSDGAERAEDQAIEGDDGDDDATDDRPAEVEREPFEPRDGDDSGMERAMRHHPADAHMLIAFRFREFRQSEAFQELITLSKSRPELLPLKLMQSACGIDLFDDIDWITLSASDVDGEPAHELIVAGAWRRDDVEACLSDFGGDVERTRDWLSHAELDGDRVAVVWLDERTALVSTRPDMPTRWYEDRRNGAVSAQEGRLGELASGIDRESTLWAVGHERDLGIDEVLPDLPPAAEQVLTFDVSADLKMFLRIGYAEPEAAAKAAGAMRTELDKLRSEAGASIYLRKVEVSDKGTDVIVTGELDRALTQMTARFAESQLRGAIP